MRLYGREKIFAPCSSNETPEKGIWRSRCHSAGKNGQIEYDNASFAERLPKSKLADLVDWDEACGLIHPLDFLTGI